MAGSTYGTILKVMTWGESHGKGIGVTVDGCPAGLLCEADIQAYLDRRKPGQSKFTTARNEGDKVEILSGVFEGRPPGRPSPWRCGTPTQRSRDYGNIMDVYRPGHVDYTFDRKYGFRDYRGGGRLRAGDHRARGRWRYRSKLLKSLGVTVMAYTKSIGPVSVAAERFDPGRMNRNRL